MADRSIHQIVGFLLNPDAAFLQQKLNDYRKQCAILTAVIGTTGTSLWLWDYVTDPVGAMHTVWLRAMIPLFAIPYLAALLFKVNIRWVPAAAFLTTLGWEIIFLENLNRLSGGMTYGIGGFMYFFVMGILLLESLSLRVNLLYALSVALIPQVLAWLGFAHGFEHAHYAALVWPAASMVMVIQFIMAIDHWRRKDYQQRLTDRERELSIANNELERRVQQRTAELYRSEMKYRRFIDTANEGIWGLDINLKTDFINTQMAGLIGYESEEMLGHPLDDFLFEGDLADHRRRMAMRRQGKSEHYERRFRRRDGSELWTWISATAICGEQGEFQGSFAMLTDITERKQAENELRLYKDQLEKTVDERTAELRLARDAAEAANKAKSLFLANMSHELRTPLNAILGYSSILYQDQDLNDGQRQNVNIINRSGEHLLTLINDVLEIAKIESGKLRLEIASFDLGTMVHDVHEMMRLRAEQKGRQLILDQSSDFPRYIRGDEVRLRQILVNLVGNAVKFTDEGGVAIRLGVETNARHHLMIEIEDTGPGISQEDQLHLFQPFVQLIVGAAQGGTGLGLAIARQFAQMMGGDIKVESTLGRGSLFRVSLPLELASKEEVSRLGGQTHGKVVGMIPSQRTLRILIAEDEYENLSLLTQIMKQIGVDPKTAENGEACVRTFSEWHPDLIWMDLRMPIMDGVEATRRIRRLPGGDEVKIVAVTASVFKEQQPEYMSAGIDDLVRKPYRVDEIFDCMTRQLGVHFMRKTTTVQNKAVLEELTSQRLGVVPENLRIELKEALESLDSEKIEKVVQKTGEFDPSIAKALSRLTESFEYPRILMLLEKVESQK